MCIARGVQKDSSDVKGHTGEIEKKRDGKLKFLIVTKRRTTPAIPLEKLREMAVREWETALQLRNEGKIEVGYALVGQKGGMSIREAESGAVLNVQLMRLPFYAFLDIEIYPLMTYEEALTQAKDSLEAVKTQK